jgi:hypothetical protein
MTFALFFKLLISMTYILLKLGQSRQEKKFGPRLVHVIQKSGDTRFSIFFSRDKNVFFALDDPVTYLCKLGHSYFPPAQ